eukprot:g1980.t1
MGNAHGELNEDEMPPGIPKKYVEQEKKKKKDERMRMNVSLPTMLSDAGLRMYRDALIPEDSLKAAKRLSEKREYVNQESLVAAEIGNCKNKSQLLEVFLKHYKILENLYLDPALDVALSQIRKDLTREVVELNGTVFADHTKNTGDLEMLEDLIKRSLIYDLIQSGSKPKVAKPRDVADEPPRPVEAPPTAPPRAQRRLTRNFMQEVDEKLHAILKALSRTNSGADSYDKVLTLFGLGGTFLVKPSALRNKPTKIMFSGSTNECIIQCYNNYDVIFLDENHSPLSGANNVLLVETRLVEVLNLADDGCDDSSRHRYRGSTRVLSITLPSVQMEMLERQLEIQATLRIYGNVYSPPSRAVMWLLRQYDIVHEFERVDVWKGEAHTDEFKKLNPTCSIPVMSHGDFTIFQAHSIMKYITDFYDLPDHFKTMKLIERSPSLKRATALSFSAARAQGGGHDSQRVEESTEGTLDSALDLLNSLLSENEFIGGDNYCLADLTAICEIEQIEANKRASIGYNIRPKSTAVRRHFDRWLETMRSLPHMADMQNEMIDVHTSVNRANKGFFSRLQTSAIDS